MYDGCRLSGMHLIGWVIWVMFLLTIFVSPYDISGQKNQRKSPLDILNHRFASGQITNEAY